MNKVLAIDPGNIESAYCVFEEKKPVKFGKMENADFKEVVLREYAGNGYDVVIENIACFGMPVGRETFDTCRWIGRFQEVASRWGIEPILIDRPDVKTYLCGKRNATDANVCQTVRDRFGQKGTKKNPGLLFGMSKDMWQACAVGIVYLETKHGR